MGRLSESVPYGTTTGSMRSQWLSRIEANTSTATSPARKTGARRKLIKFARFKESVVGRKPAALNFFDNY